ncbi:MAG: FHA domain-containing protein [Microscillaceae bacterium]|nr:FHA domain-containing protein [Microscillaceae bacterium]
MTIGRAANNDVAIPEQTVSSKHATITVQNGSFFINDLGSTNGTFVNGSRIDSKILKSGDLIKFGAAQARFEI